MELKSSNTCFSPMSQTCRGFPIIRSRSYAGVIETLNIPKITYDVDMDV